MNLYFAPNDPDNATLVSANGVAQYRITTSKASAFRNPAVTRISRPANSGQSNIVGEVEWKRWGAHPVVRSNVFDGVEQTLEVRELLYKLGSTFSTARYFLGNDNEEYRWKYAKGSGYVLTQRSTGEEIARHVLDLVKDGLFRGEQRWMLRIRPCNLDIDLIVLTFVVLEKRRRDTATEKEGEESHCEEPCEGGIEMGS